MVGRHFRQLILVGDKMDVTDDIEDERQECHVKEQERQNATAAQVFEIGFGFERVLELNRWLARHGVVHLLLAEDGDRGQRGDEKCREQRRKDPAFAKTLNIDFDCPPVVERYRAGWLCLSYYGGSEREELMKQLDRLQAHQGPSCASAKSMPIPGFAASSRLRKRRRT